MFLILIFFDIFGLTASKRNDLTQLILFRSLNRVLLLSERLVSMHIKVKLFTFLVALSSSVEEDVLHGIYLNCCLFLKVS